LAAVPSIGRASLVEAPRVAPQAAATQGLYERHAAKIQSYCQHQLGSREEAEDAVQTTFMNAFRALGRGVVPEAESAWLFKIAENVCLSRRRSSWRRGRIESPSDFDVIEEIVPGPSRQRDELIGIEDALASMPEQQRRAILLREWQGLSYREIAAELEVSQSAVETLIFRARRSLAQGLEQPDTIKPKRKSFRRALHMIDIGTIVAAAKTLLAGSAAVKATAAAVAVTAAVGTAATVTPKLEGHSPKQAPALVAAPVAAETTTASGSGGSFADSFVAAAPSAAKPLASASSRQAKPKAARAVARRSAPARGVPAAAAPAPAAPVAEEPEQVVPAEQPVAQPVAEQPAPASEEPKAEPTHEPAPPAAEPSKRTDEGKKDKGKALEPAAAAPVVTAPVERRSGHSRGSDRGKAKDKDAPTPVVEAPAPAAVTAPVTVEESTTQAKQESKHDRGRGNDKRGLTSAPSPTPAPPPVVSEQPTPVVEAAPVPATETTPAAAPTDKGSTDKSNGKGRGRGK
jgi:RNA polymerase sigma factor (sigma-70 family)